MYVPMGALSPTPACLAYVFAFFRNLERFCNCAVVIIINIVFVDDSQPVASRAGGLIDWNFIADFEPIDQMFFDSCYLPKAPSLKWLSCPVLEC
jgi:hypothetical protein